MKREDMTAAAKFRVACAFCGRGQARPTTAHTAAQWMQHHEQAHRPTTSHGAPERRETDEESHE